MSEMTSLSMTSLCFDLKEAAKCVNAASANAAHALLASLLRTLTKHKKVKKFGITYEKSFTNL